MIVRYPAGVYAITEKTDCNILGIALTQPDAPKVNIEINEFSDEWKVGDRVLFRADYNTETKTINPIASQKGSSE